MCNFFPFFLSLILISCSNQECDCSEYKDKLKEVLMNMTTPIDLPEKKPIDSSQTEQGQITAVILENNKYTFDDDPSEYNWEEYKEKLGGKLTESNFSIREIKIAGHKDARYESVFKVLAFCQANELEPILAYQN